MERISHSKITLLISALAPASLRCLRQRDVTIKFHEVNVVEPLPPLSARSATLATLCLIIP